jgi:hypothetical protein
MVIFEESKKTKDSRGNDITFSRCRDWDNNDVNSCKNNAPKDTKGWIKCAIGSDPSTVFCSPYTPDEFSCALGQECFSVSNFDDGTRFSNPAEPSCDGSGNKLSFSKCTNWFAYIKLVNNAFFHIFALFHGLQRFVKNLRG